MALSFYEILLLNFAFLETKKMVSSMKSEIIVKGLIVREPYATMIIQGVKKWEIRNKRTRTRGKIAIITKKRIIGFVELVGIKGPFTVNELIEFYEYHRADPFELKRVSRGKLLYAWELDNPIKLREPIQIKFPRGPVTWVNIRPEMLSNDKDLLHLISVLKTS